MILAFRVIGRPVPQGSMVASYNRAKGIAHVHHVQGSALALWRAEIRNAAQEAGASLTLAPVSILVTFGMPRPMAHKELRRGRYQVRKQHLNSLPAVQPDLDKLLRALMDALTGIVYRDDAQVVSVMASKIYEDHTEVVIYDERGSNEVLPIWQKNGSGLEFTPEKGTNTRQLPMSDLWDARSE